jgi:cholesterol transport system auxiliary component
MRIRSLMLAAALTAGLGGCISLLPEAEPALLYRLQTGSGQVLAAPLAGAEKVNILLGPTEFPRMSTGDRIMTVTGSQAAAIAGARWAAPTQTMFDEAVVRAFDSSSTIRLTMRANAAPATGVLRIEVRTFEAQYRSGQGAAPTAVVELRVLLSGIGEQSGEVEETAISAEVTAAENRIGPIVDAYGDATEQALSELVDWTEQVAG